MSFGRRGSLPLTALSGLSFLPPGLLLVHFEFDEIIYGLWIIHSIPLGTYTIILRLRNDQNETSITHTKHTHKKWPAGRPGPHIKRRAPGSAAPPAPPPPPPPSPLSAALTVSSPDVMSRIIFGVLRCNQHSIAYLPTSHHYPMPTTLLPLPVPIPSSPYLLLTYTLLPLPMTTNLHPLPMPIPPPLAYAYYPPPLTYAYHPPLLIPMPTTHLPINMWHGSNNTRSLSW